MFWDISELLDIFAVSGDGLNHARTFPFEDRSAGFSMFCPALERDLSDSTLKPRTP